MQSDNDRISVRHLSPNDPVGIVAGWGRYPVLVAENLRAQGRPVVVAAIKNHCDPAIRDITSDVKWLGVAKLGGQIRWFQRHGVKQVILAGKLFKDKILFGGWGWIEHFPDWTCIKTMYPHFVARSQDTRDDSLLSAVCKTFKQGGIEIVPGTDFAPELLAMAGNIGARKPRFAEQRDIEFGWEIAKQMGGLDIGQSITVRDQTVLAVEAVEGTDALIDRTGKLCPRGGFTLVKVAKPQQDARFDLPTIGVRTLELLHQAGGRCLAIEAGKTIIVDRDQVQAFARKHGIAIVALDRNIEMTESKRNAA